MADALLIRTPEVIDVGRSPSTQSSLIDRRAALRSALKAGALGAVVGIVIPLLGLVLAGAVAVFLYGRQKGVAPGARAASRVGGAAGVVLFFIGYVRWIIQISTSHGQQQYLEMLQKVWQTFGVNPTDPEIQASIRSTFSPAGMVLTFVLGFILTAAMTALVGAVASWFMRPRSRS